VEGIGTQAVHDLFRGVGVQEIIGAQLVDTIEVERGYGIGQVVGSSRGCEHACQLVGRYGNELDGRA
jgi:hypothetical protein